MKDHYVQEDFLTADWGMVQIRTFKTKPIVVIRTLVDLSRRRKHHKEWVDYEIDISTEQSSPPDEAEKLYKVRYKTVDYKFTQEVNPKLHPHKLEDNETEEEYGLMETHEETINEVELMLIEMQAEEGLTIIEEVKLITPELLPSMKRVIEYVDEKGKHKGWGLKKRD